MEVLVCWKERSGRGDNSKLWNADNFVSMDILVRDE